MLTKRRSNAVTADGQPRTMPVLAVIEAGDGWHKLVYADITSLTRKAKPEGVAWLELAILIGNQNDWRHSDAEPEGSFRTERITRTPFTIAPSPARPRSTSAAGFPEKANSPAHGRCRSR